jgi:uncharacterized membrane protein YqjE
MALLQALISLIGKSLGKILNAIFGWAVVALFGRTSPRQQVVLSALVGAAAAWPVLVLGIAFPKIAALVVAFVPLSQHVPSSIVRLVWLALALLVPMIVGVVVAAKSAGSTSESFVKRALRGFPVTIGIAGAFLLMFVTVPVLRIASLARGRQDEHIPCVTDGNGYRVVADQIDDIVHGHDLGAERTEPSWWLAAPSEFLKKLGGKALRGYSPDHLAYWKGRELEIAFYPSDILVRGNKARVAWAHGLFAERIAHGPGLQTFDPGAQDLERQIQRVWQIYDENPTEHVHSRHLLSRAAEIARDLGTLNIAYDAWQIVYRETMQLERALHGEPQILQSLATSTEATMQRSSEKEWKEATSVDRPLAGASTGELVSKLATETTVLVAKQIELAKAELRTDLKSEIKMAEGLGVAGVFALATLNMLLVTIALALSETMPGWMAASIVGGSTLAIGAVAAIVGWAKRVKKPLDKTRRTLEEDARWAKERMT